MKTKFTIVIALLITIMSFAQQSINYKALIKDTSGNILANTTVNVLFTIKKGTSLTDVYEEGHTTPTDNNGIIIVNIGDGNATLGDFSTVNWGSDNHFLNVKINIGNGFVDVSTTQFMAVPYALSAANVVLKPIDEGNGIGWRLKGQDLSKYASIGKSGIDLSQADGSFVDYGASGLNSIAFGLNTKSAGFTSTAMGDGTTAGGDHSTTMGEDTSAYGDNSTAIGYKTTASGSRSTAMGSLTNASGQSSTAMGSTTEASGQYSTAMGRSTQAEAIASTALGRYNLGGGDPLTYNATNPLFEIGNGADLLNRSNAFTVFGGTDVLSNNPVSGFVLIGNASGRNLVMDRDEIMARNNGASSNLILQANGGDVYVGGVLVHASDGRLKKDIQPLPYGLKEIIQLQPKAYNWKNREQDYKSLGLIAQEVQLIIKEVVTTQNKKDKTLGISYTELIPVLINAVKEQQIMINHLQSKLKTKSTALGNLSQRIERIEKLMYQKTDVEIANNK